MDLSVVVPTLNGRSHLRGVFDALGAVAPDAEVVVVNGPSTDGTGGLVRDHHVPDLLVDVAERNLGVARNAGVSHSEGDVVAFLGQGSAPESAWLDDIGAALDEGAQVVTGPVHRAVGGGVTTESPETARVFGREVTFFPDGNVTFTREALDALDGFDEYLPLGGGRDAAHRLAGLDREVAWRADAAVLRSDDAGAADRVARGDDVPLWGLRHLSRAYRLAKNYGPRPDVLASTTRRALHDAREALAVVLAGERGLSAWLGDGRDVVTSLTRGGVAGLRARASDRSPRRNPNGVSSRSDRAVLTERL